MPLQSPDLNPIENVWHEFKEYLHWEIKHTNKSELIDGISQFWLTMDVHKYLRYIGHLQKVIPRVLQVNGNATSH